MAFHWQANDGPLSVYFRSSLPSSKNKQKKNYTKKMLSELYPPPPPSRQNFLDPRMTAHSNNAKECKGATSE